MKDFPKDELEDIRYRENFYIEDTRKNTFVSEDELKNGIFENIRTKLLEEETFLVPYYKGEIVPQEAKSEQNIDDFASPYAFIETGVFFIYGIALL